MEKTWEDFWKTGRVTDYLAYCNSTKDRNSDSQKDSNKDGTDSCIDRDGLKFHAY